MLGASGGASHRTWLAALAEANIIVESAMELRQGGPSNGNLVTVSTRLTRAEPSLLSETSSKS